LNVARSGRNEDFIFRLPSACDSIEENRTF